MKTHGFWLAGLSVLVGMPANAIVIRNDVGVDGALALGQQFTGVVGWSTRENTWCSGSLIGEHKKTILTARHCLLGASGEIQKLTPKDVYFRGAADGQAQTIEVAGSKWLDTPNTPNVPTDWFLDGYDLAVLYLKETAPAWATPLDFSWATPNVLIGSLFRTVGFGAYGVGDDPTMSPDVLKLEVVRRAAENTVDYYGAAVDGVRQGFGVAPFPNNKVCTEAVGTGNILSADFDGPRANDYNSLADCKSAAALLPNEGITAPGDSGGPLLIKPPASDTWLIAGVTSGGWRTLDGLNVNPPGYWYGNIGWWTATAMHKDWILSQIPEPASLALLALGLAGLGLSRRRKA